MAKSAKGFTLLEFSIVTVIVAALSAMLLLRFGEMRREAEGAAARHVLAALESALRVRVARAAGDPASIARLAAENPIHWLAGPPSNYVGEMETLDPTAVPGNSWVFETRDKTLVYLPSTRETLPFPTSRLLRFKVEFPRTPDPGAPSITMAATHGSDFHPVLARAGH